MSVRGVAVALVAAPAVAATAAGGSAITPTIWHFLGYPFEAAGLISALFGCGTARLWIGAAAHLRREHRWTLDVPISGMALATAAAAVIWLRPEPFAALMAGAALGVLGEGIFKLAEQYLPKGLGPKTDA